MNAKERVLLSRNSYYVKEHTSWRKVTIEFDIYDSEAGMIDNSGLLMQCREDNITKLGEFLRFITRGDNGPCDVNITGPDKQQIVRIRKGFTFSTHKFDIFDSDDRPIGFFYRKTSLSKSPQQLDFCIAEGVVQYVLSRREDSFHSFSLSEGKKVHATITKIGGLKEAIIQFVKSLSGADHYLVEVSDNVPTTSIVRRLVLAAVVIVDYSFYGTSYGSS